MSPLIQTYLSALCTRQGFLPRSPRANTASSDSISTTATDVEAISLTGFHAKWLKRRGFAQGRTLLSSKNRNFLKLLTSDSITSQTAKMWPIRCTNYISCRVSQKRRTVFEELWHCFLFLLQ